MIVIEAKRFTGSKEQMPYAFAPAIMEGVILCRLIGMRRPVPGSSSSMQRIERAKISRLRKEALLQSEKSLILNVIIR